MTTNIPLHEDISNLFRIRKTVLELLSDRGYAVLNTAEDLNLSRQDFEAEFESNKYNREMLTLLRQRRDDPSDQVYVFFPEETRGKMVGVTPISDKVQRMERDKVKSSIIVIQLGLTSQARQVVDKLNGGDRVKVEVFVENELLVNITKHILVPKHEVLTDRQKVDLLKRYKLKDSQLPRIQKKDPIARYYGMVLGQVVKITRPSETAGRYITYRICV